MIKEVRPEPARLVYLGVLTRAWPVAEPNVRQTAFNEKLSERTPVQVRAACSSS